MSKSIQQLTRETQRLAAIGQRMPEATAVTLQHRLAILAGLSPRSAVSQYAELWRMSLEKPAAFWQAWIVASALPWQFWTAWTAAMVSPKVDPDLPMRVTADALRGIRRSLAPLHAGVTGNARRLSRDRR